MNLDQLATRLEDKLAGSISREVLLARLTTYRLGGPAALLVEPAGVDDLEELGRALRDLDPGRTTEVLAVGRGSNLVVSDAGWAGIVVRVGSAFSWIDSWTGPGAPEGGVRTGAGTSLPQLANWAARRGLAGLEWAVGVPGSVGGAVRMNAGAHGTETSDVLVEARVFDLTGAELVTRPADTLALAYRHSNLDASDLVVEAFLALTRDEPSTIKERTESFRRHRAATQPGAAQNAGSVFTNPPGDSAGRLVEAAGLKGFRIGGASVSVLHANFFMADDDATAQDVFDLVAEVRARVRRRSGVDLVPEIRFVGSFASSSEVP
ncbi:MAG: UDP-N-acetylmuramate dehydrogenase [Actinomycetota bacterium]